MTSEGQQDVKMMALDDVIKASLKEGKGRRFNKGNRRRSFLRRKYLDNKPKTEKRRRIQVENLNKELQNPYLINLFKPYGKLTRCGIRFDKLGASTGIADVEFSTPEECLNAIKALDNADVEGSKIRVMYAPNPLPRFGRRGRSAGTQRRHIRKINRTRRTGVRNGRNGNRRGVRGTSGGRKTFGRKRRNFRSTLGRRRQEKKQN